MWSVVREAQSLRKHFSDPRGDSRLFSYSVTYAALLPKTHHTEPNVSKYTYTCKLIEATTPDPLKPIVLVSFTP